ncbi:MAG TPA: TolC family protein [Myxococcota bacterium]|nr:TolC family protein [Myxococcota bacterium]
MVWSRALALACCLTAAAGCRHVAPQPLSPEESSARLAAQTLADPGLRDFLAQQSERAAEPWPQARWDLRDLTLAALYFSPELRVARATSGVAAAHVGAEAQRPNPTLSFLPQRVANPGSASPWLAAVQLDFPIETAGKRARRKAAAEARASAADLAVRTEAWRVRSEVYEGVVGQLAADLRRDALARTVELRAQRLALLEERRMVGAIAEAIVAPERLALAQANADLAAAERERITARAALAAAVGVPASALDAVAIAFDLDAPPADPEDLAGASARRAALLGRSDVLALLAEYDAAEQDLRLELAKQYPDLHLGPGYEYDQGEDKWGLGVTLDLPLLSQNGGGIDEALARRGEVAARFEALQAQVIREVDAASAAASGARREQQIAQGVLEQARERSALAERSLALGAVDRVAALDAELELQLATAVLIDAEERLHRAVARLERAVESAPERES